MDKENLECFKNVAEQIADKIVYGSSFGSEPRWPGMS